MQALYSNAPWVSALYPQAENRTVLEQQPAGVVPFKRCLDLLPSGFAS